MKTILTEYLTDANTNYDKKLKDQYLETLKYSAHLPFDVINEGLQSAIIKHSQWGNSVKACLIDAFPSDIELAKEWSTNVNIQDFKDSILGS